MPAVTTAGVAALAVAGFAMSYDALHDLARSERVPAALAWAWPLVVSKVFDRRRHRQYTRGAAAWE